MMYGRPMKDWNWHRGGYGRINVTRILEVSSNVGTSSIIDQFYHDNPQKFVDGLKRMSIDQPLHLQIAGEGKPNIRGPKERYFAKTTLPWMSIGYETQVPPMNILTFYNAIANDGVMVRPKFVKAAVKDGEVVKEFPTEVINPKICSDNTLKQIREILYKVVHQGLAGPGRQQAVCRIRQNRNGTDFTRRRRIQNGQDELFSQLLRILPFGSAEIQLHRLHSEAGASGFRWVDGR